MYKKRPEQFTAFDDENNPDTSKEKSDREKFVDAIRLFNETANLWREKAAELTTISEDLGNANQRRDHLEIARRINALDDLNLKQHAILTKQYDKQRDLLPDEFSKKLRKPIEKDKRDETQTDDDKRDTLQSLDDDELKNFTV